MGTYSDLTDAELIALTRQRRLERHTRLEVEAAHAGARHTGLLTVKERKAWGAAGATVYYRAKADPHERVGKLADPRHRHWQSKRRGRPPTGPQSERHLAEVMARGALVGEFWRTFEAQGGACYLCALEFTDNHWATEDHVRPKGRGGADRWGNKLLAHSGCNTWKADRPARPCEVIYLHAVNLRLGRKSSGLLPGVKGGWLPLRQRLAAQAAE